MNLLNILSAQKELDTYLDSIQGRIDLFTNALQTFWMNLISSDVVKGVVDIGTVLVKFLDTAIGKATVLFGLFKGFSLYGQFKASGQESFLDFLLGGAKEGLGKAKDLSGISNIVSVFKDAFNLELGKAFTGQGFFDILTNSLTGESGGQVDEFLDLLGLGNAAQLASVTISKEVIEAKLKEAVAQGILNQETAEGILNSGLFATAQTGAAGATNILSASIAGLTAVFNGLKASFMSLWATHPALVVFAGVALAITAIAAAYEKLGPTHENAIKKLEKETEELQSVQDELTSVNSELESIQDSMNKLESKDKLTFVEEQELDRLRAVSAELERQKAILEAKESREKAQQIKAAVDAAEKDTNLQGGANDAPVYAAISEKTGLIDHSKFNRFDANLNALENAKKKLADAENALNAADERNMNATSPHYKQLVKDVENAREAVERCNSALDTMGADWQANYGEVGFITKADGEELTAVEAKWNDIYRAYQDAMDKQALLNKDITKVDVLDRVFGKTGTDAAIAFKKEFAAAFRRGEDPKEIIQKLLENEDYFKLFKQVFNKFGITNADIIGWFTNTGSAIASGDLVETKTYSSLAGSLESINEVQKQTNEILTNGTTVTQEYKDALIDLVGSEEKVNECFVDGSSLVVKNADGLEDLLKVSKKNIANQAKLAKTQARLKYAELYKEMQKVRNGETELNQATKDRINAIYKEMSALQSSIAKYSMLENKLLGATNAYERLAEAQEIDEANDYGSRAEELVEVLGTAFKTAELGTESAKVAISGLIPESVYEDAETLDAKMAAIHEYFKEGEVSKLFTIKYDEEGGIESVEMTKKNVRDTMNALTSKTFDGGTGTILQNINGKFSLNPAIDSLNEFAEACNWTEEVAFAFLTSVEKYDISHLGGDNSSWLEQLMGDDLEYRAHKITEEMADLEHQFANGKIGINEYREEMDGLGYQLQSGAITQEQYDTTVAKLNAELRDGSITLEEYTRTLKGLNGVQNLNNQQIKNNVVAWAEANQNVADAKTKLAEATKELEKMNKPGSVATQEEIDAQTNKVQELSKKLSDALVKKYNLEEPTEMTIQLAMDEANWQIEKFEAEHSVLLTKVKIVQDDEGNYSYTINSDVNLKAKEYQEIGQYINMLNEQHVLSVMADENPDDAVSELEHCKTVAEAVQTAIDNIKDPSISTENARDQINQLINTINSIPDAVITATVSIAKADGTANALGTAYAGGNWGAEKTETALVGELGPEILVRGSHWTTIGNNGAEFTQVKKGDIIFNHKQSEQLLKNGYITGRGRMVGGAFANGTDTNIGSSNIDNELKKYIYLLNQYDQDVRDAVNSSNEYVQNLDDKYKKYGNIDNTDRNIVFWNDKAFKKHYSYIVDQAKRESRNVDEYYDTELRDNWSTVLGSSGSFGFNGKQFEIAYSQMLNDGGETILLTFEELMQYVLDLMEKSLVNGEVSPDKMMELDAIGLEKEVQGKLVTVKDMLAGVEGQIVDGVALTIDDILAMAHPTIDPETGKSNELGKKIDSIYEGFSMHDIQAESLFGEFTKQYGGVSEAFLQLEELSYQYGMTLDALTEKLYSLQQGIKTTNNLYNNAPKVVYTPNNPQSPGWTHTTGGGRYAMLHGTAFAEGNGGAPKTETALVGELGPELLIRGNQWTTVGDNGAEFTQVKKGDVIFNHKQTESLLKNGHVSSRGKIQGSNSAFAHGTAYLFAIGTGGGAGTIEKTQAVQDKFFAQQVVVKTQDAAVTSENIAGPTTAIPQSTVDWYDTSMNSDSGGSGSGSGDKEEDTDKETFDWIEVKLEEINEKIGLTEAKLENASNLTEQNNTIDELISIHQDLYNNLTAASDVYHAHAETLLAKIPEEYRQMAKDGIIKVEDFEGEDRQKILESIQEYREWVQKAADVTQQAEETITTLRDLAIQQFDNAREAGDVKVAIEDSQIEKLQNAVDFDEASGIITSDAYYIAMMKDVDDKIKLLTEAKNNMQKEFNDLMTSVPNFVGSNAYYEKLNEMYEMDSEIANARIELEEFQNAINDLDVERFDQLIARLDYVQKDTQNLIDLMSDEDMFVKPEGQTYEGGTVKFWKEEDVAWTDEGLATLGLYAQQMEVAKAGAAACAEQIQKLKDAYAAGKLSENEYLEQLSELTGQQVDFEKTAKDSWKAIHDLKSEQIDYIKQGIEKETEAYEELINKKKENLREDKNARDFQRSVSDKQKEIDDLERRIAVLSNNNSAWAKGELARLNAELAEKKQDMTDLYDDHALELEEKALDDSYESVKNANEAKIEELDKFLENYELVIEDTYTVIKANAERIGATLTETTEEYNLTVSDAVLSPWKDGAFAIGIYQEKFDAATSSTTSKLNDIRDAWQEVIDKTQEAGDANVAQFNKDNAAYTVAEQKQPVVQNKPTATASGGGTYTVKRGDTLWGIAASKLGSGARWQEIYNLNKDVISNPDLIQPGWKLKLPKYAKGTTGVKNNQLAILDELGDELQLVPDGNGRLAYMTKGTSVIPHDITENLMTLGQLDPQDIIDRNRPVISAPHVSTNETVISIEYGDILHIDNYSGDKPENLSKLIDKAFDKHMKQLNSEIRKFTR